MILCIDIGNSNSKALFCPSSGAERYYERFKLEDCEELLSISDLRVLVSRTGRNHELERLLERHRCLNVLDHRYPLNIRLDYDSPKTLGSDRIAAAVAAHALYPSKSKLIVDSGTCLTIDLVDSEGVFRGGVISPGIHMRLRAMHQFTAALPKVDPDANLRFPGRTTTESMQLGASRAMMHEIKGFVDDCQGEYGELIIVDCSAHQLDFELGSNYVIFAHPKLVLEGLKIVAQTHA